MFDIGFSELLVIGVVALIVIGPERLPKVARTAGHLLGRLQRYVNDVKADINREMELDELRKLKTQVQDAARSIEESVTHASRDFETAVRTAETDMNRIASGVDATSPIGAGGAEGQSSGEASLASAPAHLTPPEPPAPTPPLTEPPAPVAPAPRTHAVSAPASAAASASPASTPPRQGSLPGLDQA